MVLCAHGDVLAYVSGVVDMTQFNAYMTNLLVLSPHVLMSRFNCTFCIEEVDCFTAPPDPLSFQSHDMSQFVDSVLGSK